VTAPLSQRAEPSPSTPRFGICFVSEELAPESGNGGIGTYVDVAARGLTAMGYRVHVVARGWGRDRIVDVEGVQVHRLTVGEPTWRRGSRFVTTRLAETRDILGWNRRVASRVRQLQATGQIDVVECPEYRAQCVLYALRATRLPVVVRLHTPAYLCRELDHTTPAGGASDSALSEHAERWLARRAALVTSPSIDLANRVAARWRLDQARVEVVPNPVDDQQFRPSSADGQSQASIVYVGRIERRKGVETLVAALPAVLRQFPDVRVTFVGGDHGSGPGGRSMTEHLQAALRRAGIADAVEFGGAVERPRLPSVYGRAAICVVPSQYENFPYTCLEAMASGCAVVASAVGGIPEIVTDGHDGLLVPPGEPAALAAALARLLAAPDARHAMAAQARHTVVRRFSPSAVCARAASLYGQACRAGARGRAR
jgi:glycosyltransferase involved in cell wall biosynthesis